jgi:methyltransferase (TIGR00027 family)
MKENEASFTAMMTAYMRAYHSMHDTPKIFDDFLANRLIPVEKQTLIEQYFDQYFEQYFSCGEQLNDSKHTETHFDRTTTSAYLMQATNVISRSRYTEDTLEKAVRQGVKQYVILGAGLDTFAFRRSDMMEQLEISEVDHPATQSFKLHRLAELVWGHPAKLHFIPIDFTKENLITALTRSSSYDPDVKSFFSWLGVTYYLTRDEVFATLRSITDIAPAGSTVVFDYLDTNAFVPEKSSQQMQKKLKFLRKIGEPMITGFNPSILAEDLARLGCCLHENLTPADIEERYFKGRMDGYHAQEHVHLACATVE